MFEVRSTQTLVKINNTLLYLKHHFPNEVFWKSFISIILKSLLHQLIQVLLHVLEHKVEGVVLPDHLLQLDHVVVAQLLEGLHLTQLHGVLPVVVLLLHLLDGNLQL